MKRTHIITATALTLGLAAAAQAQSVADQVVSQLQADGFDRIEVTNGRTQVKVEAIRGNTQVEYVYDLRTGELLEQEVYRTVDDDIRPGVTVRSRDRDFQETGGSRSDDRRGDDDESDDERDDDERDDDERDDDERDDDERDDDERDDDERDDDDEDDDEEDDDEEDDEDDD